MKKHTKWVIRYDALQLLIQNIEYRMKNQLSIWNNIVEMNTRFA